LDSRGKKQFEDVTKTNFRKKISYRKQLNRSRVRWCSHW